MVETLFLFAHGAGASSASPWMQRYKRNLESIGEVVCFDYDYVKQGRRRPDPLNQLIACHRAALVDARKQHPGKLILIGKSMGGRIGCHLALVEDVDALVCLGYPLKAAGKSGKLRDEVLVKIRTPILFVQGTRDPLCPLDLLEVARLKMTAPNSLYVVAGGNHSLEPRAADLRAKPGRTLGDVEAEIITEIGKLAHRV